MNDAFASPQSVLVLGGRSDLGLAITRALVRRRARRVILAGRNPGDLKPAADELVALGAETVERVAFDALDPESHDALVDSVFDHHGDIDLALVAFGVLVRPGFVPTKMTAGRDKAPFSTTPDAVADAVVRGLEKGVEVVWAPPLLRYVMAVARHLPRPVFRRLKA